MSSLSGKVVFITGGARGIGAEVARRLRAKGARLVLTDLDEPPTGRVGRRTRRRHPRPHRPGRRAGPARHATGRRCRGGEVRRIDIVLANAGIASFGSVLQVDPEAFKRVVEVNVVGVFNTVRATLPAVIDRRGYVLVVSSLAAFTSSPGGLSAYHASKAGAEYFANTLRLEVAHLGVDVGSAHMSWIDTPPLVQDAKADLSAFREMLSKLPTPAESDHHRGSCGEAFVKGIEAAVSASTARTGSGGCSAGSGRSSPPRWSNSGSGGAHPRSCCPSWTRGRRTGRSLSARTEALQKD